MHHVLITYCTLKSIYFAEIAFVCDVGAIKLTDICLIIIIWPRKKKGKRCDLKKINYNKVNSNFFLSVSKVCAILIVSVLGGKCPGGKCPGGICPRGYMS